MTATGTRRRRLVRIAAAAAAAATLVVPAGVAAQEEDPGVYVQDLPPEPEIVPIATGVPVLIGVGTPVNGGTGPVQVSSPEEFAQLVTGPSASLERAVTDYFAAGGGQAMIAATASEDGPGITGALDQVAAWSGWDLLVAPALGDLPTGEWMPTATAMAATADQAGGVVLLDPPTDAAAAAPADGGAALVAVAQQFRSTSPSAGAATMYSSGLLDGTGGVAVAAAPVVAGFIAATDAEVGPWGQPAGPGRPIDGATPSILIDNALAGTLDAEGITPIMNVPGYGTVVMGTRTLSREPEHEYLTTVRTVDFIAGSIRSGLAPFVFSANDGTTWSVVTSSVAQFLTTVWQDGGLQGQSPAEAFSVAVGLGSTMTAQDILNGYMVVAVGVAVQQAGEMIELSLSQQMQGS